jgi:hypothetical protein
LDQCHHQMARALQKDGWQVGKPKAIVYNNSKDIVYIDLEATYTSNGANVVYQHIYVEIKCFAPPLNSRELHAALGQYLIYRAVLGRQDTPTALYLAVPENAHNDLNEVVQEVLRENKIKVIVVNLETEKVVKWIE